MLLLIISNLSFQWPHEIDEQYCQPNLFPIEMVNNVRKCRIYQVFRLDNQSVKPNIHQNDPTLLKIFGLVKV
jgi:hypothetical protein